MGNKSSGATFGTFIWRFHISTALSEKNVPLINDQLRVLFLVKIEFVLPAIS